MVALHTIWWGTDSLELLSSASVLCLTSEFCASLLSVVDFRWDVLLFLRVGVFSHPVKLAWCTVPFPRSRPLWWETVGFSLTGVFLSSHEVGKPDSSETCLLSPHLSTFPPSELSSVFYVTKKKEINTTSMKWHPVRKIRTFPLTLFTHSPAFFFLFDDDDVWYFTRRVGARWSIFGIMMCWILLIILFIYTRWQWIWNFRILLGNKDSIIKHTQNNDKQYILKVI